MSFFIHQYLLLISKHFMLLDFILLVLLTNIVTQTTVRRHKSENC